jgi:hypothetical protein
MPAGGVGVTGAAMVLATPGAEAPLPGGCAGAADPTGEAPEPEPPNGCAGELRCADEAAPGADADSRCPQCWQKANPMGVPLPQAGQMALGGEAGEAAGACDDAGAGALASAAMVAAEPSGAAAGFAMSEVPHILQKFMPGGFSVPHAPQVIPLPAAATGLGAADGSMRWPQS